MLQGRGPGARGGGEAEVVKRGCLGDNSRGKWVGSAYKRGYKIKSMKAQPYYYIVLY